MTDDGFSVKAIFAFVGNLLGLGLSWIPFLGLLWWLCIAGLTLLAWQDTNRGRKAGRGLTVACVIIVIWNFLTVAFINLTMCAFVAVY